MADLELWCKARYEKVEIFKQEENEKIHHDLISGPLTIYRGTVDSPP